MTLTSQNIELRVVRLEENTYFLEEKLKALDEHVLAQQKQLDELNQLVMDLRERIMALEDENAELKGASSTPELPPHYREKPL